ncbi:putative glycosyl transferase [Tolypothrix sp. NIES-4075]|uniref:glycosyltransferase n=1 Tax=Tolypothrix sp. NIES-4075 TaxID=2005459 RepID=UPI000B5C9AB0|nr:glycosyltransferase [Tolypothrix sp. NIES-4075]GAX43513.1 putative glycosyl transferase [Tolypothrix sp. NIES-4075]
MDTEPLVSIIITSYNYAQYIGQAIESVLCQTYNNWELIIIDDCSNDNSLNVIRSFEDERIQLLTSEKNQGVAASHNKAYALCQGKYFCNLDADDYMAPEKLEKQVRYLESHPEVDILGTYIIEVDSESQPILGGKHEIWFNREIDLNQSENWIWRNHLCHSSVMMRKSAHALTGLFSDDLIYPRDYEFWIRCFVNKLSFEILAEKLTYYRFHGNNITYKYENKFYLSAAYIFCKHLRYYFESIQRFDIIARAVYLLIEFSDLYSENTSEFKANLVEILLDCDASKLNIDSFLQILHKPADKNFIVISKLVDNYRVEKDDFQSHIQELQQGKDWLESQYHNSMQIAQETQTELERSHSWIQELQQGKDWLESQYNNWKEKAQETQTELERSHSWIQELQQGKDWLESQYHNSMQIAQETQTELERSQLQLQQTQTELESTQFTLATMQSSKFCKLRNAWLQIKQLINLKK